ncbi:uncharacterized protein LOC141914707 [Tubulanus polymorphus]|uniref:uncharacterized protein LOC141914707 n=1 Tax=Tubulanus polymorphus TaxID=672921 RepID=UPI003DA46A5C
MESTVKKEKTFPLIQSKCNNKAKSSMVSVLQQYGFKEPKKKTVRIKEEKPKRRKKKSFVDDTDDEKEEERKRKQNEEKYLQVHDDLKKLKHYYYHQYMDMLTDKVNKQRQEIKKRSIESENRLQITRLRSKSRLPRLKHKLIHDDSFMRDLPKSYYYQMVKLEENLYKTGKIKNAEDSDAFWENHGRFISDVDGEEEPEEDSGNEPPVMDKPVISTQSRQLSLLEEESSRPGSQEGPRPGWAVTQQAPPKNRKPAIPVQRRTKGGKNRISALNLSSKSATKLDADLIFPKIEMPKLHCFTMDLSKPPPDPIEEAEKFEMKEREFYRQTFVQRLRKMYQLALTNTASTQRIVDKHGMDDLFLFLEGPQLSDIIDETSFKKLSNKSQQRQDDIREEISIDRLETLHPIRTILEERESEICSSNGSMKQQVSEREFDEIDEKEEQVLPQHLTYNAMINGAKIIEAKCPSSFWINYAKDVPVKT